MTLYCSDAAQHKSAEILDADGAPVFSFSCQFYEIRVSEVLSVKVTGLFHL